MVERREGISQKAHLNDPWTWITIWGWTVEAGGGGLDGGG